MQITVYHHRTELFRKVIKGKKDVIRLVANSKEWLMDRAIGSDATPADLVLTVWNAGNHAMLGTVVDDANGCQAYWIGAAAGQMPSWFRVLPPGKPTTDEA